jgi:hypothetical protein
MESYKPGEIEEIEYKPCARCGEVRVILQARACA